MSLGASVFCFVSETSPVTWSPSLVPKQVVGVTVLRFLPDYSHALEMP